MRVLLVLVWMLLPSVAVAGTISSQPTIPAPLVSTDAVPASRVGSTSPYKMTVGQIYGYVNGSTVFGDATDGTYSVNISSASSSTAPLHYEIYKTDATANVVRITPATGTVRGQEYLDLDVQGMGIRLTANPADNNWY